MRITKKILSIVLAMTMAFGCLAIGFTAAAVETPSLQAAIDATPAGGTCVWSGAKLITGSFTISKDITIDFNGAQIKGNDGEPVFTIMGGNVTIIDAQIDAKFGPYSSKNLNKTILLENSEPAIDIMGGNVVLKDVHCNGAFMRIPTTTSYSVQVGSGIELKNGATLVVDSCALIGRYGINNAVSGSAAGGAVTFIDGMSVGFIRSIKNLSNVTLAKGSIQYPIASLINGLQSPGISMNAEELAVVSALLDGRAYVAAVKSTLTTSQVCTNGKLVVTIETDDTNVIADGYVSYKWAPEAASINGKTVDVVENNGVYTATFDNMDSGDYNIDVRQRMFIDVTDTNDFIVNLPTYIKNILNTIPSKVKNGVAEIDKAYPSIVNTCYSVFDQFTDVRKYCAGTSGGAPGYDIIINAFLAVGGKRMVDHFGYNLLDSQGVPVVVPQGAGLLERFEALLADLKLHNATAEEIAVWAVNNYAQTVKIVEELLDQVNAVYTVLTTEPWAGMLKTPLIEQIMPKIKEYMALIEKYAPYLEIANKAVAKYESYVASPNGQAIVRNLTTANVKHAFSIINNSDIYYNPKIINKQWLKFTSCSAGAKISVVNDVFQSAIVTASASGLGTVTLTGSTQNVADTQRGSIEEKLAEKVTISAKANEGNKFSFWMNNETGRIVSYDASFTFKVGSSIEYKAYFAPIQVVKVTFTTMSNGQIFTEEFEKGEDYTYLLKSTVAPDVYGYDFVEWKNVSISPDAVVYQATYTRKTTNDCVVSFVNQDSQFTGAGNYSIYDTVTVSAPNDGFGYWADQNGVPVSYFSTYSFIVTGSVKLSPVYTTGVAAGVALNITKTTSNPETNKIAFYAERSIKGYELIQTGIILTSDASIGVNPDLFVIGANNVIKGTSTSTQTAGTYIVNKSNAGTSIWYARAYAVVKATDGTVSTVYSSTAFASIY